MLGRNCGFLRTLSNGDLSSLGFDESSVILILWNATVSFGVCFYGCCERVRLPANRWVLIVKGVHREDWVGHQDALFIPMGLVYVKG